MNAITADALRKAGYREYPANPHDEHKRLFQKRVDDDNGTLYFVNFHEWEHPITPGLSYEAQLSCETNTGGTIWVTIKEVDIAATESRAAIIWAAAGGVYYDL